MRCAVSLSLMLAVVTMAACAQLHSVPIPPGETPLGDIGIYRVSYQSHDKPVVDFPDSWVGHFEEVSGVSYAPGELVLGRPAILLHSPWRVPPGRAWVDYSLALPRITPLGLSFGIAMRPDMVAPGHSDGVTFSCALIVAGAHEELMRTHWAQGEWKDYHFDLSAYAGKTVTLRLQTEPGPRNDPSFDYSYFGDPRIIAGTAEGGRSARLEALTASRAYQATAGIGLERLANDPGHGVTPSNLLPVTNRVARSAGGVEFVYEGADARVVYTYSPRTGTLDDFTVQVDAGRPLSPALGGGATVTLPRDGQAHSLPLRGGRAVRQELDEARKTLTVDWEYLAEGRTIPVTWTFGIVGKALTIAARCEEPVLSAFSLGNVGNAPLRRTIYVPYLPADWNRGAVAYLPVENLFVCRYLDWTVSHASRCPQGEAAYDTRTDGTRNPLLEAGYVAVSSHVGEVLPNIPYPPSPYLKLLAGRIMLDIWGHHQGTYQGDADNLRALKDNGVDRVAIIQHVWQRYGYDAKLPDHMPANPEFGPETGLIEFGKAAREAGYVWSLHENYIDLYPDAPSYDPTARVLRGDGTPSPAWYNAGTKVQSFGLKCNRALGYARQNAPRAHLRYGTNAAYLDVHTCVPPWHQLDHEAGQPLAAMAHAKVKCDGELFQYMREAHEGPLFGEGANHFYWAGKCDGVEAQVAGGENHDPLLDLDLLKLHPQMVNHGMGYYERWFQRGYEHRWGHDTGTMEQIDKYRAQELAYGHAGFVGGAQVDNIQWVAREHHLVSPVQALYGAARPTSILYEVDGKLVAAGVALALAQRLRQRVQYDSGLTVWVNWGASAWEVEGRVLGRWGFLALGPGTEVCSVVRDGKHADFVDCPEYLFADARTSFSMPYLHATRDIAPRLRECKYLGEGRIRLTYEWIINDTLDDDYHCFVHFTNPEERAAGEIAFQQDHALPRPTGRWQKGEVLVDGPYEVTVPADRFDTYDIVIGLFKGARVPLKGIQAGGDRILIGRLRLTREGGKITTVTLEDPKTLAQGGEVARADFTAHLNPAGTFVDFGKLATDGSVKVNRGTRELTVFPYPREREFRVLLDLPATVPGAPADGSRVQVRALAAGTCEDMGPVACSMERGRVGFRVGLKGAGRYVVRW